MKLMMITTYATPTNMRRELLEAVAAKGHQIVVAAPTSGDSIAPAVHEFGGEFVEWQVSRTAIDPRADLTAAAQLFAIMRRHRPDAVLIYQIKAVLLAPVVAKLARIRRIVVLVNGLGSVFYDHGFGATRKARIARSLYGFSLRNVDTIVFHNNDDPKLLESMHILSPKQNRCVVPGSGVDTSTLRPVPVRDSLPPTFTLVGRLLISKGVRDFATAAREIKARHPHVVFRLAGQIEESNHPDRIAETEIDQWVRDGIVDYIGFATDIAALLAATTVFVLPSYREGLPRTSLEAMAMGLPVITTDAPGCRDTVEDGVNGFLIPPRDVAALVSRIERYLAVPDLIAAHGLAGRNRAQRAFDLQIVNRLMIDALQL